VGRWIHLNLSEGRGRKKRVCSAEITNPTAFLYFLGFEFDSSKACLTSSIQAITGGAKGFLALDGRMAADEMTDEIPIRKGSEIVSPRFV
jgi:hypothetical protein